MAAPVNEDRLAIVVFEYAQRTGERITLGLDRPPASLPICVAKSALEDLARIVPRELCAKLDDLGYFEIGNVLMEKGFDVIWPG